MKGKVINLENPPNLFDQTGHLNDSGISLYVEARLLNKEHKLPKEIKAHVQECASCQMRIVDFHQFMKNEAVEVKTPHPYLDQKTSLLGTRNKYLVGRVAAVALLLVVGYFMLFENTRSNIPPATQSLIASPFDNKKIDVGYNQWEMDAEKPKVFQLKNGSNIHVPAQAFVNKSGQAISGKVQIKYREFHNAADIIASGLPMHYDSAGIRYHFESGGMFELRGNQNGEPVYIANDKSIAVNIVSYNKDKNFNHYYLNEGNTQRQSSVNQAQVLPLKKVYQQASQPHWQLIGSAKTQPATKKDTINTLVDLTTTEGQAQGSEKNTAIQSTIDNQSQGTLAQPTTTQTSPNTFDPNAEYFKLKYALDFEPELKHFVPVKWTFAGDNSANNPKQAQNQWMMNEPWHKVTLTQLPFGFKTIDLHKKQVLSASYSPSGQHILTYDAGSVANLLSRDGQLIKSFPQVNSAQISKSGKYILTTQSNAVQLWSIEGKLINTLPQGNAITLAVLSDDERFVITTNTEEVSQLWDLKGKLVRTFREHFKYVSFSPDGQYMATISSRDFSLKIWTSDGKYLHQLKGEYNTVLFSPDSRHLLTSSDDNAAQLWFFENKYYNTMLMTAFKHRDKVNSAKFSHNGHYVVTASDDGTAKLWNTSGQHLHTFKMSKYYWVTSAEFSADDRLILTASDDGSAQIWNRTDGKLLHTLRGHEKGLKGAIFSPDQQDIITFSEDHSLKIWDRSKTMEDVYALDLSNIGPRYEKLHKEELQKFMMKLRKKRPVKKIKKKFFTIIKMYRPPVDTITHTTDTVNQLATLNQQYTEEIADVKLDIEKIEKENSQLKAKEAQYFHNFQVRQFGYCNIDRIIPIAGRDIVRCRAKVNLGQSYTYFTRFYLITAQQRTGVVRFNPEDLKSFWFAANFDNQLVVVLPKNRVAIFSPEDFRKIDLERLKKDREYLFDLSQSHEVHSKEEFEQLLNATP